MVPQLDLDQQELAAANRILHAVEHIERKLDNLERFYNNQVLYNHPKDFQRTVTRNAKIPIGILNLLRMLKDGIIDAEIAKLGYDGETIQG